MLLPYRLLKVSVGPSFVLCLSYLFWTSQSISYTWDGFSETCMYYSKASNHFLVIPQEFLSLFYVACKGEFYLYCFAFLRRNPRAYLFS